MQILDILEPDINESQTNEIAIGIDLGTTNTLGAIFLDGKVEFLGGIMPSRVHIEGEQLEIDYANRSTSAYSIKSLMGKKVSDLSSDDLKSKNIKVANNQINIKLSESEYSAVELSSFILTQIKARAQDIAGHSITKAVITVPAYFDDIARQATLNAAKLAGLEVLRLINEPTAAAVAYGLDNHQEGIYAVYDFGGGTFDCTILCMQMGVFKVVATAGDNQLGGDDIDALLMQHFLSQNSLDPVNDPKLFLHLKDQFRRVKEDIFGQQSVTQIIYYLNEIFTYSLTKKEFNELIQPIVSETYNLFNQLLFESKLNFQNLEGIIMVGGSSRIEVIGEYFGNFIARDKIYDSHDPEKIVAAGAAIQAFNLANYCGKLLLDVVPLSISLEVYGGLCEKIINKNSLIPTIVKKSFTTHEDGQSGIIFNILQGERELAKDCRLLAHFELKNIPPMKAGLPVIEVEFKVDADGLLAVSAIETSTENKISVEIRPDFGLNQNKINQMIEDSYSHATQDLLLKYKIETISKAQELVKSINRMTSERADIYEDSNEEKEMLDKIKNLEEALKKEDLSEIEAKYLTISSMAEKLANKYISLVMSSEFKDKNLEEIKETYLEKVIG